MKVFRTSILLLAAVLLWPRAGTEIVYVFGSDGRECAVEINVDESPANNKTAGSIHKEFVVAKDGSGDFRTIQEAVDNAGDGDTINICPGVYCESVLVLGKELNLTGTDKDECMILYDTASYLAVPLTMAAGKVSNLTIYGVHIRESGMLQHEVNWVISRYGEETGIKYLKLFQGVSGYAVHADQDFSYGRELRFENCRIISENSACVGIGSRGGERIIFERCELLSKGIQPCVYLHDCPLPEIGGETYFALHDSLLQMESPEQVLRFDTMLDCNNYVFDFRNVMVRAPGIDYGGRLVEINDFSKHRGSSAYGWCGLDNAVLTPYSGGNTIDEMNWDTYRQGIYEKVRSSCLGWDILTPTTCEIMHNSGSV